jgi:excisionase family DNA binding protein
VNQEPKRIYLVTELAKKAGVSQAYIRRLLANGRIKGEKVGGVWTITKKEVDKYLKSREKRT